MLSKKNLKKQPEAAKQGKAPKRMWAGKVPENNGSGDVPTPQNESKEKKLIYKGYTGDSAGIIVDTSAGMVHLKKQKLPEDKQAKEEAKKR